MYSYHTLVPLKKITLHFIALPIIASRSPYNSASKRCKLCLKEKLIIICRPELSSLNKRNELVSSCSHRGKALLRKNWTKFTATPIMQVRKVYKRWLRIFLTIKSPDEWVITKQACRDESIVFFFPFLNICVYIFVCVCVRVFACVRVCVCVHFGFVCVEFFFLFLQ